jgi:hypothetical protein
LTAALAVLPALLGFGSKKGKFVGKKESRKQERSVS